MYTCHHSSANGTPRNSLGKAMPPTRHATQHIVVLLLQCCKKTIKENLIKNEHKTCARRHNPSKEKLKIKTNANKLRGDKLRSGVILHTASSSAWVTGTICDFLSRNVWRPWSDERAARRIPDFRLCRSSEGKPGVGNGNDKAPFFVFFFSLPSL